MGDGNGFVRCALGHRHWGVYGAAGLLITDGPRVLLHKRAAWTHEGGSWAVPGGARDSHEDALTAALREATEETTLDPDRVTAFDEFTDEHGGWSYTTVLARPTDPFELRPVGAESDAVRWWPLADVATLELHYGFAAAWPHLLALLPVA